MRFPDRDRHVVFLEPEGVDVPEIYVSGCSMCLPREVQEAVMQAMPGLAGARMLRPGYAVERRRPCCHKTGSLDQPDGTL